jgi:glycosyltransferase involved in cell wall biosynthesis
MGRELAEAMPDAIMPGTVVGEALQRWYASADVFVFPSTTETFGNVVLEAQASGLPAVVPAAGGVADVVRHGVTGLVVRPNDPAGLGSGIEALLRDAAFRARLGRQARAGAASRSWDEINLGLIASWSRVAAEAERRLDRAA